MSRRHLLSAETPLIPDLIAGVVLEEVEYILGMRLPRRTSYSLALSNRANRTYAASASFRRRINRRGNAGRDCLYMFMRHWCAALLLREEPGLDWHHLRQNPAWRDFAVGKNPPSALRST